MIYLLLLKKNRRVDWPHTQFMAAPCPDSKCMVQFNQPNRFEPAFLIKPWMNRAALVTSTVWGPTDPKLLSSTGPYVQQQRGSQESGNLNLCFSKRFCSSSIYIYIALNCFSLVSYDSGIEIAEFDQVDLLLFSSCSAAFGCCGCINGSGLLTLEFKASG